VRLRVFIVLLAILSGCGYVGQPLAPTLDIPKAVTDFRAWEYGANIEVEFTLPDITTEGLALNSIRLVEVGVGESPSPYSLETWGLAAKKYPVATGRQTREIPVSDWVGKTIMLAVRATGPKGKTSMWSNSQSLKVVPPLAAPTGIKPTNDPRGVALSWTGEGPKYRIFRAEGEGKPELLADVDQPTYVDESTNYGTRYQYLVQAIASDNQWSVVSQPFEITPRDVFPPAIPGGVMAVAGAQSIEITWNRNTESDFRGYNIFRSVDSGMFQKVASLIDTPVFSDTMINSGKRYRYKVSAVDQVGNESAQSDAAEAVAQ